MRFTQSLDYGILAKRRFSRTMLGSRLFPTRLAAVDTLLSCPMCNCSPNQRIRTVVWLRSQAFNIGMRYEIALAIPYILTLRVYAGVVGRTRMPKALGLPYIKD